MALLIPATDLPGHERLASAPLVVLALCPDWCGTCRDFRPVLERIAASRPGALFAWADIEDDAGLVGDIDVEDFPCLAVYRKGAALHFGSALPHEGVVARLLEALMERSDPASGIPEAVRELGTRLAR